MKKTHTHAYIENKEKLININHMKRTYIIIIIIFIIQHTQQYIGKIFLSIFFFWKHTKKNFIYIVNLSLSMTNYKFILCKFFQSSISQACTRKIAKIFSSPIVKFYFLICLRCRNIIIFKSEEKKESESHMYKNEWWTVKLIYFFKDKITLLFSIFIYRN